MKINYTHSETLHNKSAAYEILPFIFNLFHPASVIDVGSGTGSWLSVAKELGAKKVLGTDGILVDRDLLFISEEEFLKHNLSQPLVLSEKYDLAICLEVVEHLPIEAAEIIVDTLTHHSDIILFSAAIPNQGGQYHINEQWPDYWQEKFLMRGYAAYDILRDKFWENSNIEWWYKQNMIVYAKPEKMSSLNYLPVKNITRKIHPELFAVKINDINNLGQILKNNVWQPKFKSSLKLLIKSILNAIK